MRCRSQPVPVWEASQPSRIAALYTQRDAHFFKGHYISIRPSKMPVGYCCTALVKHQGWAMQAMAGCRVMLAGLKKQGLNLPVHGGALLHCQDYGLETASPPLDQPSPAQSTTGPCQYLPVPPAVALLLQQDQP